MLPPRLCLLRLVLFLLMVVGCQPKAATSPEGPTESVAEPPPVSIRVAPVTIRPVERRVAVVGSLMGLEVITVTPKVEGRILATHFDVSDRVRPGDILLELDPTDYRLAVDESQRGLEQELARLDLLQPPGPEFDMEQLPTVERARLLLENAERQFARQKSLLETNAGARQTFEQAETDRKVADAGLRQARLEARTALASVRHRESQLAVAQQKLADTRVAVPQLAAEIDHVSVDSFVISQRMVSVGEMVRAFPSTPVYELVVDDALKVRTMVPERYLAQVKLGLDVELRVEAYPEERFPGRVTRINPTINPLNRSFEVEAIVPNRDHRLRHGGFVKAEVIVDRAAQATTVPQVAITRFAGVSKVFRVRGDQVEEVEVHLGTQGGEWVEVLGGLSAGDQIVTSGQSRLSDGARIVIQTPEAETAGTP